MSTADEILSRLSRALGLASDSELAKRLKVGRSTVSGWRTRDSLPIRQIIEIAELENISMDWLLLDRGSRQFTSQVGENKATSQHLSSLFAHREWGAKTGLDLNLVAGLARVSNSGRMWGVLEHLLNVYPKFANIEQLQASLGSTESVSDLASYVGLLLRLGLVREHDGGYGLDPGAQLLRMRSKGDADVYQHTIYVVEQLLQEVLPAVEANRGKLITISGSVPKGEALKLLNDILKEINDRMSSAPDAKQGEDSEGFRLVLGVAAENGGVISSEG